MFDPGEYIRRLNNPVQARWTAERTDRVLRGLQRRGRQRVILPILGLLAAAVAMIFLFRDHRSAPPLLTATQAVPASATATAKTEPGAKTLRLQDGSIARPLDPTTALQIQRDEPTAALLHLSHGRVFFDVVPRPGRLFRVAAGPVTVEVLGTAFTVSRADDRVEVQVERGRVRVLWPGGQHELSAGQQGSFPPIPEPAPIDLKSPPHLPQVVPHRPEPDRPGHLLIAADAARLSGQRQQALAALQRFQKDYSADRRVTLAAFTEGRLLLELGQASAAAQTFRRLQELAPQGPLHEDALAREVQALDQAGELDQARSRAAEYLRLYPSGSRRALVVKHGHLPAAQ